MQQDALNTLTWFLLSILVLELHYTLDFEERIQRLLFRYVALLPYQILSPAARIRSKKNSINTKILLFETFGSEKSVVIESLFEKKKFKYSCCGRHLKSSVEVCCYEQSKNRGEQFKPNTINPCSQRFPLQKVMCSFFSLGSLSQSPITNQNAQQNTSDIENKTFFHFNELNSSNLMWNWTLTQQYIK